MQNVRNVYLVKVGVQACVVAEAAGKHKPVSPGLKPNLGKKGVEMVEADYVLRPVPHGQVSSMPQDEVRALLQRLSVKLVKVHGEGAKG